MSDAVTTLGAGVDGAVRRVATAYDGQGNVLKVTSYNAASGGSVVNEVQRAFDGLGQLTTEWQQRGAAVNTGTSPKVQYAYSFSGTGTANQSRLTAVTYPSGYAVTHNYAAGLDGTISRLSSLSDATGTLEGYDYLGLGTVVRRAHPLPGVDLTYIKQGAEPNGEAGDQYTGLDRFGRVVDQRWLKTSTGAAVDRFQYGYDENSNRLFRDNLTNLASGELYGYDFLNQIASFQRGTLNGTRTGLTGAATRSQSWDYDALGNWDSVTTNGTAQARTANKQNEVTSIGGATTPTYDANGNMTGDETGRQFVYDAWNRLVTVKDSGGTTLATFGYDGLSRRVTRTAGGTTTDLYYSADWQVVEEKVGANTAARYVWSPVYVDALVLRDRDTDANGTLDERLWVAQDANWNVTALLDGSGAVVERYAYDPFGVRTVYDSGYVVRMGGSSYDFQHGFQGTWYDSTAGFNEMDWRWYSPTLGRWSSLDPIRFEGSDVNLYGFVGSNPIAYIDPTGLKGKNGVRVWITFVGDRTTAGAAHWHSLWATTNMANPFTKSRVTIVATTFEDAIAQLRNRIDDDECISELNFAGHGDPGRWWLDKDAEKNQKKPAKGTGGNVLSTADLDAYLQYLKQGNQNAAAGTLNEAFDRLRAHMCDTSVACLLMCDQAKGPGGDDFCKKLSLSLNKWVQANDALYEGWGKGSWWEYHLDKEIIKLD